MKIKQNKKIFAHLGTSLETRKTSGLETRATFYLRKEKVYNEALSNNFLSFPRFIGQLPSDYLNLIDFGFIISL